MGWQEKRRRLRFFKMTKAQRKVKKPSLFSKWGGIVSRLILSLSLIIGGTFADAVDFETLNYSEIRSEILEANSGQWIYINFARGQGIISSLRVPDEFGGRDRDLRPEPNSNIGALGTVADLCITETVLFDRDPGSGFSGLQGAACIVK